MNSKLRVVLQLLGIGWFVAICIGGGAFGGLWIDRLAGTAPAFTLTGIALGIAVAIVGMVRMLMAVLKAYSQSDGEG
jgi:F0F1-type ATP synthase assembly protein I